MAKYRVGVIGCGRKGGQHARAYALNPLTEVVAFADTDPENLALYCEYYGVPGYSDYREMLEKEQIDIAAPILPVRPNPEVVTLGVLKRVYGQSSAKSPLRQRLQMRIGWWEPANREESSWGLVT